MSEVPAGLAGGHPSPQGHPRIWSFSKMALGRGARSPAFVALSQAGGLCGVQAAAGPGPAGPPSGGPGRRGQPQTCLLARALAATPGHSALRWSPRPLQAGKLRSCCPTEDRNGTRGGAQGTGRLSSQGQVLVTSLTAPPSPLWWLEEGGRARRRGRSWSLCRPLGAAGFFDL